MRLARNHIAASTASAYAGSERYFLRFLAILYGVDADRPRATRLVLAQLHAPEDAVLAAYVAFLARPSATGPGPSYRTIKQYLKGVSYCLRMYGHASPLAALPVLSMVLQGARRANGVQPRPKSPITPDMLHFFVNALLCTESGGATLRAAMLVCFIGLLRKCFVFADRSQPLSSFAGLRRGDVRVSESDYSLVLSLKHSKTNQYGERVTVIRLAGLRGHVLDPVGAFTAMCALCPAGPAMPAFCVLLDGVVSVLCHQDFVAVTKRLVHDMGGEVSDYSGHSYRRGGATCAHAAGVPGLDIMRVGDWTSDQYLDYIWRSPAQCRACSESMMRAIAASALPDLRMGNMRR